MLSKMNDSFFHIFKCEPFDFCLICKEDILHSSETSDENHVLNHIYSSHHQDNIRSLFRMCIPDPLCGSTDTQCVDIVTRSVFEIAVLDENKGSYICQNEKQYVCLMCQIKISDVHCPYEEVKQNIVDHLESECHFISVKDVCWFYRLKLKKDYLLFHKSVVYCSICNDTYQCREDNLLRTVICHLQTKEHNEPQHPDFTADQDNTSEKEEWCEKKNMHVVCPQCREMIEIFNPFSMLIHFQKHEGESVRTDKLSFDYKDYEVCCLCEEKVLKINGKSKLFSHNCKVSNEHYRNTLSDDLVEHEMCFSNKETQNVLETYGYNALKYRAIKRNIKFINIRNDICYCNLCWIQFNHPKYDPMLTTVLKHFRHARHRKNIRTSLSDNIMYKNRIKRKKHKILKIIKEIAHGRHGYPHRGKKQKKKKKKVKEHRNGQQSGTQENGECKNLGN